MRHWHGMRHARQDRMAFDAGLLENADTFLTQRSSIDVVKEEHSGMHGQARPYGRTGAGARPVDHPRKIGPVRFVLELLRARLRPGYDETIERRVAEIVDAEVKVFDGVTAPF